MNARLGGGAVGHDPNQHAGFHTDSAGNLIFDHHPKRGDLVADQLCTTRLTSSTESRTLFALRRATD